MTPDTNSFAAQPPPHELPTTSGSYASWTAAGVLVYSSFLLACVLVAVAVREIHRLRVAAEALLARTIETRDALRRET